NLVEPLVMTVAVPPVAPPFASFPPRLNVATVSVEPSIDWSVPTVPRRPPFPGPPLAGVWAAVDVEGDPPPARAFTPKKPPTTSTITPTTAAITQGRRERASGRA